jgi:spectinomycin phosphotransferase
MTMEGVPASILEAEYGYVPRAIRRIEGGTVGAAYSIDDRYFLKVYDQTEALAGRLAETLPRQLRALELLQNGSPLRDRICAPIRTRAGALCAAREGRTAALYNFIPGEAIGFGNPYTARDLAQLSALVEALHQVDARQFAGLCPEETYALPFAAPLRRLLTLEMDALPPDFARTVRPYAEKAEGRLREAEAMADVLRQRNLPHVLCHTDIHGGNVMRDESGRIYLVDWENLLLAPKEADLYWLWAEYPAHFARGVDAAAAAFYAVRRDLEDIWEFLNSVRRRECDLQTQIEALGHVRRILGRLCDETARA